MSNWAVTTSPQKSSWIGLYRGAYPYHHPGINLLNLISTHPKTQWWKFWMNTKNIWVDSMNEAADAVISMVDYCEKIDRVKKDTFNLIKEKRQYAKQKLRSTKSSINKFHKEIHQKLNKH